MKPTEIPRAELEAALKNLESWKDHADPFYLRCIRALLERAEDTEHLNSGRIWLPIVRTACTTPGLSKICGKPSTPPARRPTMPSDQISRE